MASYTIGQVAERTGFTASALRYYEGIGLLAPSARTAAGYRLYDDDAVARLAFVARAKQLGCSLDEVVDLVGVWDGECGPVQRRLHELVTAKIDDARRRSADLAAFARQLQVAATQLAGPPSDGPCGDSCACVASPAVACTLAPGDLPDRLAAWHDVLAGAVAQERTPDGTRRLRFGPDVDVAALARLAAEEQRCCAFFAFAITVDDGGVGLEVRAPDAAEEIVDALFGYAPAPGEAASAVACACSGR